MKVDLNPSLRGLSGTFNDWVYRTINGPRVVGLGRRRIIDVMPSGAIDELGGGRM